MAAQPHRADSTRFAIRPATKADVPAITDCFLKSMYQSERHAVIELYQLIGSGFNAPFWQYTWPDDSKSRKWLNEAWTIGIDNPTDRTFVVEDTQNGNKIVAWSRWMLPQSDGNQERKWPDVNPDDYDMDVLGAFFGGMEENRAVLMEKRPHWCEFRSDFS
jgi:hypothetical protein